MEAIEECFHEIGPHTTEDIRALPEGQRAELIDGYIYMMVTPMSFLPPSPSIWTGKKQKGSG